MKKWAWGFIIGSLLLNACAMGVLLTAASVVTGSGVAMLNDRRHPDIQSSDGEIAKKINQLINKEPFLQNNTRIFAETYNKIVLLTGEAPNEAQAVYAKQLAESVTGVRKVYNEILSFEPRSEQQAHNDLLTSTRVNSTLLGYVGINVSLVQVTVNHDRAYLMGLVTQEEARSLVNLVRRVDGVRQVIPLFEYVKIVKT
jgi:osmotically-inducible protein OsmY